MEIVRTAQRTADSWRANRTGRVTTQARRGAQIFLVGQLGKYLPGSVWAEVLQLELGRRAGLARAWVFAATLFSLGVAVVAALVVG